LRPHLPSPSSAAALRGATRRRPAHRDADDGDTDFDVLVVGAGTAGCVMAERLASLGARVLVVERRDHVGGLAHDRLNAQGLLVHPHGPHIFHTQSTAVVEYLSRFTGWRPYEHRVRASVQGQLVPLPVNVDTVNLLCGLALEPHELQAHLRRVAEPRERFDTMEDVVLAKVGRALYDKLLRGHLRKHHGADPATLDAARAARVPTRASHDDRCFTDRFQAMPQHGFTAMFERMLAHPRITLRLGTDHTTAAQEVSWRHLVYTGPIDAFFGFRHGALPYRRLRFRHETLPQSWLQPVGTVSYPNEHAYTRVTEFKHLTGQQHPQTAVVYEFPGDEQDEPCYPVPRPEPLALYRRYEAEAQALDDVTFIGRLASYTYANMDVVVAQALAASEALAPRLLRSPRPGRPAARCARRRPRSG
jgi:UDP-galactopyranose mutase